MQINNKHCCLLFLSNIERPDAYVYKVPNAHSSIINGIDAVANGSRSEIVTGGRDGLIKVWDPRQCSKPAVEIRPKTVCPYYISIERYGSANRSHDCVI